MSVLDTYISGSGDICVCSHKPVIPADLVRHVFTAGCVGM